MEDDFKLFLLRLRVTRRRRQRSFIIESFDFHDRSSRNRGRSSGGESSARVCAIILSSMRRLAVALVSPLRRKNRPWFACNRATANNSASGRRAMPRSCKHASRIERRSLLSWVSSAYSGKKDVKILDCFYYQQVFLLSYR